MSHLPRKQRSKLLTTTTLVTHTANTVTDPDELERRLHEIRRQGFAIGDEEFLDGVVCLALPIPGRGRRCNAGVAVSAPAARLSADKARSHVTALRRGAERLSAALLNVADA